MRGTPYHTPMGYGYFIAPARVDRNTGAFDCRTVRRLRRAGMLVRGARMDDPTDSDALRIVLARRQRPHHRLRRALLWATGVLLLLVLVTAGLGVAAVALFLSEPTKFVSCDLAAERPAALGQSSFLYARDGARLGAAG
jgi:hypothetical protein